MLKDQIIILAGGKGTRLDHFELPKVLVPINGRPIIFYLLDQISTISQNQKPVVVVGFMAEKVKKALGERYEYALQESQLGTAHAVKAAKKNIHAENVLVLYGDMPFITENSLRKLIRLHHDQSSKISIFTTSVPNFTDDFSSLNAFGRIIRNFKNEIIKITEFKDCTSREKGIKEVNPGIYMFNSEWLWQNIKQIKNKNAQKEYYLGDIVEIAINQKLPINSLEIPPKEVFGINSKEDLESAEKVM